MATKGLGDAGGQDLFREPKTLQSSSEQVDQTEPDHIGHRQRLRERFLAGGTDSLPDYELLELMLFMAQPRADTKPIAKELLRRFGSFAEVISAEADALRDVKGIGDAGVVALKAAQAAAQRLLRAKVKSQPVVGSFSALIDYCTAQIAYNAVEQFRVIYLDKKNKVIADEEQQKGTVDHTPVYPREVVKRALELNASALIMVHNHPSGDPKPSQADIDMTRKVKEAAGTVGLVLHDHIIVSRGGHASFKTMGLL
ncbi:MAG: DNA repair protein RadC [Rhodospirillaceae bacterium]|nr:DNA repair protein RadC [Rhodospirillaceae bacterium]